VGLKKVSDKMTGSLNKITAEVSKFPKEAYKYWVSKTPKATGNARRKTKLQGTTIKADYNYAAPLDRGHSNQAPRGMSKPTEDFVKKLADKKIRK
jgi:hypothetical protein